LANVLILHFAVTYCLASYSFDDNSYIKELQG
jgi:hypothetical protein